LQGVDYITSQILKQNYIGLKKKMKKYSKKRMNWFFKKQPSNYFCKANKIKEYSQTQQYSRHEKTISNLCVVLSQYE
jgi:hypothetical protein